MSILIGLGIIAIASLAIVGVIAVSSWNNKGKKSDDQQKLLNEIRKIGK